MKKFKIFIILFLIVILVYFGYGISSDALNFQNSLQCIDTETHKYRF